MSERTREIELIRQNDYDLMFQYSELLCLRAELATLLFPVKISPARKCRIRPRNRSAARPMKRDERPASSAPILLLVAERPQT
jgi:hypothetical protein